MIYLAGEADQAVPEAGAANDTQRALDPANFIVQGSLNCSIFFRYTINTLVLFLHFSIGWYQSPHFFGPYHISKLDQLLPCFITQMQYIAPSSLPFTFSVLYSNLEDQLLFTFYQPTLASTGQVAASILRTSIMFGADNTHHISPANFSAFQRFSHRPTLFSFSTLLFQSSASWFNSLHKKIIQSWRTIRLHFKSCPYRTSGKW